MNVIRRCGAETFLRIRWLWESSTRWRTKTWRSQMSIRGWRDTWWICESSTMSHTWGCVSASWGYPGLAPLLERQRRAVIESPTRALSTTDMLVECDAWNWPYLPHECLIQFRLVQPDSGRTFTSGNCCCDSLSTYEWSSSSSVCCHEGHQSRIWGFFGLWAKSTRGT